MKLNLYSPRLCYLLVPFHARSMVAGRSPALVERLQARSDVDSKSFFDAHGLGAAYRQAGDKSSKRAKINAALSVKGSTPIRVGQALGAPQRQIALARSSPSM